MTAVLNFARTFPGLTATITAVIILLPIILELLEFVQRIRLALGQ